MIYVAYFVLIFTVIQFIVVSINLATVVVYKAYITHKNPLISILIPARNEAKNIANIISDIQQQPYTNFELIVCDDNSTDGTAEIVRQIAFTDKRISLHSISLLPAGWLGKNYACYSLSTQAKGEYFLFLDADVRLSGTILVNMVAYIQKEKFALVSIFPKQLMQSFGEKVTVPVMNYILLTLLPLLAVSKAKQPSLAAANGQFMFFDALHYKQINPHAAVRNNKVEDIAIARLYKQAQLGVACLLGNNTITCRMYTNFNEACNGFAKNVLQFFGGSALIAFLFWMVTTWGILFVFFFLPIEFTLLYLVAYLSTRAMVSVLSIQNIKNNLFYLFFQQIAFGVFIFKAIGYMFKKNQQWKGRNI